MSDLSRDILSEYRADKIPPMPVEVFGRKLFIRRRTNQDRLRCDAAIITKMPERSGDKTEMARHLWPAAVVITCLVDADGEPVFTLDQLQAVAELDEVEIDRAFQAASEFNNLDRNAVEDAKKNSLNGQGSGNGSVLLVNSE